MRTILIDADLLVYSGANSAQRTIEWEPGCYTVHANLGEATHLIDDKLSRICDALKADRMVLALSDYTDPWRKAVLPTIKGNRAGLNKPVLMGPIREYLHGRYEVFQRPTLEADDVLGILSTHPTLLPGQKIVVTIDKDLKGVPGFLANLDRAAEGSEDVEEITEVDADHWHLFQTLTGDTTDNYPGCPGVGPVKAATILAKLHGEAAWDAIVAAYQKAGLGEEAALQNARVARICRFRDYDFAAKRVILWNPPGGGGN